MEATERATLAPFAQKSGDSRGRKYREQSHAYRTQFQRDRARIIHSRAFRRLEYKTQVFLNSTADHLRTRLTHPFEVASITRTIARALALNEHLAEAIAPAHDVGHSPLRHPGEPLLAGALREHWVARASRFGGPVVVMWGREDRVLPVEHVAEAGNVMPQARVELIDACGHLPQVERTDAFLAALLPFLDRAEAAAAA